MLMNNELFLRRLEVVAKFFEERFLRPSFEEYEKSGADDWSALRLFVRGYAFEHQGRSPNFGPVASAVLKNLKDKKESLADRSTSANVWNGFCKMMGDQMKKESTTDEERMNAMVNPLAPRGTPYKRKSKRGGETRTIERKTGKASIIEFVQGCNELNIVVWTKRMLDASDGNGVQKAHEELKCINGINKKIASLWLRDITWHFQIKPDRNRELLFPVDIWIRRAASILVGDENAKDERIASGAIKECARLGLSPEKVNMGLWYLGAQIAESGYEMKKALSDEKFFVSLVQNHLEKMSRAVDSARSVISSWQSD